MGRCLSHVGTEDFPLTHRIQGYWDRADTEGDQTPDPEQAACPPLRLVEDHGSPGLEVVV